MTRTLWRAAPTVDPYFGHGSYWSPTLPFANRFQLWLDEYFPEEQHIVYLAEVDLTGSIDVPFGTWVDSTTLTKERLATFAGDGYRWLSFYEGVWEGEVPRQFVYLGTDAITAQPAATK